LFATMPQLRSSDDVSMVRVARRVTAASASAAGGDRPVFASLRGGLGGLVPATLSASDATVVTGRSVRRVERSASGFRVVHGPTTDEQAMEADAVVVAVPAVPAARLLSDLAPVAAAELSGIDYASVVIVTLAYAPDEESKSLQGSGFLVPAVEGRSVKAATFTSSKWGHPAGGPFVVRVSFGRAGDVAVLQRDDADLAALAAQELSLLAGLPARPVAWRVSRWGGGLPQYAVGHLDRVARVRAAVAAVPGLAVCGAAYDGVGIPACIRSARAAAEQVLRSL
jgi:oxygen-dependent protoporphyrinogen oxidase